MFNRQLSFHIVSFALIVSVFVAWSVPGVCQPAGAEQRLIVSIKETPPFVIKESDTTWSGISVRLWQDIADQLGYQFEWQETDLVGMIDGLADSSLHVGVGALTITSDRESRMDFTHSFYNTGLGIAVMKSAKGGWLQVVESLFTWDFFKIIIYLLIGLFLVGVIVWAFERRRNPEEFGGSAGKGIGSGFWWSAVTMTTVGYGDKAPRTLGGRIVAFVWMFAALMLVASFTASITSFLTVAQLESRITSPEDLRHVQVVSVEGSTSHLYLQEMNIPHRRLADPQACLVAVHAGEAVAAVYDAPILQYLIKQQFAEDLSVLPIRFNEQDYGFGLQNGSPLRESINQVLLEEIQQPSWRSMIEQYVGESN